MVNPYRTGLVGRVTIEIDMPDAPADHGGQGGPGACAINIIENALHAMPAGGVLRLEASLADEGQIRLDIRDTGVGMDAASLDRIFEPYFSTRGSGTGLGLTIAKRNIELNDGTIVASTRGKAHDRDDHTADGSGGGVTS